MGYRDDLDAFVRRRTHDDAEEALFASFRRSQQTRWRRGLALTVAGLVGAMVLLYGWQLATPTASAHRAPTVIRHPAPHRAAADRRCLHRALELRFRDPRSPSWTDDLVDELAPPCL